MTNKTTSAIDLVEYLQSWVDGLDGSEERGMLQQSIARINAQSDTITRLQAALDWQRDLLVRWLATADTGLWRDKTELSIAAHPVADDTREALRSSVGGE